MNDRAYDIINKIQRWLVALGAFYLVIAEIFHLPFADEVNKTIVAIGTLIATLLEIETTKWQKDHAVAVLDLNEITKEEEEK